MTKERAVVLIVDDERRFRETLAELVTSEGHTAREAASGNDALADLAGGAAPDVILLDIRMPGADGLTVLREIRERHLSEAPVIMVSAYEDSERTIAAMRGGAYDYVTKPVDIEELSATIHRAIEQHRLTLAAPAPAAPDVDDIATVPPATLLGTSRPIRDLLKQVGRVAATDATVLIAGESGTGKELVARAIHQHSARGRQPFIAVNCGALAETLIGPELFGHERGAFTGAERQRKGRFEMAHRGTLFLDEVGELSATAQVGLLRVLQERRFERVGGSDTVAVDVRVIAATNRELEADVQTGRFREDLFYRLKVVHVHLPPLRSRLGDVPLLAEHFVERTCAQHQIDRKVLSADAVRRLLTYEFPGNVRELQNVIERAVVASSSRVIGPEQLELADTVDSRNEAVTPLLDLPFDEAVAALEKLLIRRALDAASGNRTEAALLLKINRRLLYSKMRDHNLN